MDLRRQLSGWTKHSECSNSAEYPLVHCCRYIFLSGSGLILCVDDRFMDVDEQMALQLQMDEMDHAAPI